MDNPDPQSVTNRRQQVAASMGFGIALGAALGAVLGNIALGLAVGIISGGVTSLWRAKRK